MVTFLERIQRGTYRPLLRSLRNALLEGCLIVVAIIYVVAELLGQMPACRVRRMPPVTTGRISMDTTPARPISTDDRRRCAGFSEERGVTYRAQGDEA